MSLRYKGAVISATPPTTTGGNSGTAPGAWTLQQQLQAQAAGNWPPQPVWYVEDVFSTWLYTGNGSTQTITNGIDLAGKGGLVWTKVRSTTYSHFLADTIRGAGSVLSTNNTNAADTGGNLYSGFNTNGYGVTTSYGSGTNGNGATFASWTFRKQPKFFDVVTYTGNGAQTQLINHSLGSIPGCVIIKRTDSTSDWNVSHQSAGANGVGYFGDAQLFLNTTAAINTNSTTFFCDRATSTTFRAYLAPGSSVGGNISGATYVAYLFAHNAGGFGLTGTDNVISCGSYTRSGSSLINVNLGWEAQFVLIKQSSAADDWYIYDAMRGMPLLGTARGLNPNLSNAESGLTAPVVYPTATGFAVDPASGIAGADGATSIYIAIRRGPMKTPTSGTSVFGLNARSGTGANATVTGGAGVTDLAIIKNRTGTNPSWLWASRLTGTGYLSSNATTAETAAGTTILQANPWDVMDGVKVGTTSTTTNASSNTFINYLIDRAPGFMDVVCTQSGQYAVPHNLGVPPELIISKQRDSGGNPEWWVTVPSLGYAYLSTTGAFFGAPVYGAFTATNFTTPIIGAYNAVNYLFASCPGVSKVGSYTGTGNTQTISCGFAARFVLIKRTDSTGNWVVWDTARGMVAGTDPRLALNSTAAETNANWVYTNASGFQIVTTDATVNASGGSYIYLAIA